MSILRGKFQRWEEGPGGGGFAIPGLWGRQQVKKEQHSVSSPSGILREGPRQRKAMEVLQMLLAKDNGKGEENRHSQSVLCVPVLCSGLHVLSGPHSPLLITLRGREYHQPFYQSVKLRHGEGAGLAKEFPVSEAPDYTWLTFSITPNVSHHVAEAYTQEEKPPRPQGLQLSPAPWLCPPVGSERSCGLKGRSEETADGGKEPLPGRAQAQHCLCFQTRAGLKGAGIFDGTKASLPPTLSPSLLPERHGLFS